jgi:hypothetical protein
MKKLTTSLAAGAFKYHQYHGRKFRETESKMQAVKIPFFA